MYVDAYFPVVEASGRAAMHVIASGPVESLDQIRNGFLKMIANARKSIYIQTPYLIQDSAILDAIRTSALSGVDVRIMIPNKPDHLFVRSASLSFIEELSSVGAKVYSYENGFLHAKTIMVDDEVFSTGSANMDVRSFSLNFEANTLIYSAEAAKEMVRIFFNDAKLSSEVTKDYFENMSAFKRFKLQIARLIAPIL